MSQKEVNKVVKERIDWLSGQVLAISKDIMLIKSILVREICDSGGDLGWYFDVESEHHTE